ncbi:MAG: hypothetical protein WCJ30_10575, partial [Deltaproteobacteria bacterium]
EGKGRIVPGRHGGPGFRHGGWITIRHVWLRKYATSHAGGGGKQRARASTPRRMSTSRTAWHVSFGRLLAERAAPGIEVRAEVPHGAEPQRSDFLLLRRAGGHRADDDARGRVLKGLWQHLADETLMEFKSVSRPYAPRDLERLLGYGFQWWVANVHLATHADLTLALVVAGRTRVLDRSVASLGLAWREMADGYHSLDGTPFGLLVVELDVVARAEHDDLVGIFGHAGMTSDEARRWWAVQRGTRGVEGMRLEELEGFTEIERKYLESMTPEQRLAGLSPEQRLAGLAPEQRLAGLAPEQRLAGLAPEELILGLPDDVLRKLPDALVGGLPPAVRARIRARLGR